MKARPFVKQQPPGMTQDCAVCAEPRVGPPVHQSEEDAAAPVPPPHHARNRFVPLHGARPPTTAGSIGTTPARDGYATGRPGHRLGTDRGNGASACGVVRLCRSPGGEESASCPRRAVIDEPDEGGSTSPDRGHLRDESDTSSMFLMPRLSFYNTPALPMQYVLPSIFAILVITPSSSCRCSSGAPTRPEGPVRSPAPRPADGASCAPPSRSPSQE